MPPGTQILPMSRLLLPVGNSDFIFLAVRQSWVRLQDHFQLLALRHPDSYRAQDDVFLDVTQHSFHLRSDQP